MNVLRFIAPPDDIVGQLLLDFADVVAKSDSRDEAIPFLRAGTTLWRIAG